MAQNSGLSAMERGIPQGILGGLVGMLFTVTLQGRGDLPDSLFVTAAGGLIFGLGWALGGACPGPMFALVGAGFTVFLAMILSALVGVRAYAALRSRLPH